MQILDVTIVQRNGKIMKMQEQLRQVMRGIILIRLPGRLQLILFMILEMEMIEHESDKHKN